MGGAASAMNDMKEKAQQAAAKANEMKNQAQAKIEEVKKQAQDAIDAAYAYLHEWVPEISGATPPNGSDLLIGYKALALCKLSYLTTDTHPECADLEAKWIKALNISNYQMWYALTATMEAAKKLVENDENKNKMDKMAGGAEAISGIITNATPELTGPMPFICYRGTQSPSDMLSDLASLLPADFITTNGTKIGPTGMGFNEHYKALRGVVNSLIGNKTLVQFAVEEAKKSKHGLLICGHSLGSAIATLLAAEIYTDYPNQFPIHIITFGGPRVFDQKTAEKVHSFPLARYLRFINSGDLITVLGDKAATPLVHSGNAILCPPPPKGDDIYGDAHDFQVIPRNSVFDWALKPSDLAKALGTFALAMAAPHSINGKGSYASRFDNSPIFKQEIESISQADIKESFKVIPTIYEIPTPKPPKTT